MEIGDASGEGKEIPGKKGVLGSDTPLPVGPGPGVRGPAIPANDYGLAGIFALSGKFNQDSVVRIVVGDKGYYMLHLEWTVGQPPPQVKWTCVHLKEFHGLPLASTFTTNGPNAVTTNGGPPAEKKLASGDPTINFACPWAGFAGNLSAAITDQENRSYALHDEGSGENVTWLVAQATKGTTINSFAFCSAFRNSNFFWRFYGHTPGLGDGQANHVFLPVRPKQYWCYMEGVAVGNKGDPQAFTAGLGVDENPPPPHDAGGSIYYEDVDNAGLYWNCLPLEQPGF